MSKLWRITLLALTVNLPSLAFGGQGTHSLSDIAGTAAIEMQRRAKEHGYSDVDVQVRPLDSRLQLAQCDQPLDTRPETSGNPLGPVSIGIRCEGEQPWTLYVRGQVSAFVELPVVAAPVARGEIVSKHDVSIQNRRITNEIAGIAMNLDDIIGKEARRSLAAGDEFRFSDLKAPVIVDRGQQVSIVTGGNGLRVSMQGKSLSAGAVGDRVFVANLKTGKRVEGTISSDGSVVVN